MGPSLACIATIRQEFYGDSCHLPTVDLDCSQRGLRFPRHGPVTIADDRHIAWNVDTTLSGHLDQTHRDGIISGDDPIQLAWLREELATGVHASRDAEVNVDDLVGA